MGLYKLRFFLILLILPFVNLYSQVTFEFCATAKYGNTITMDFKVYNNTGAAIQDYNFVFDWKKVSNVIMWSGMDVVKNGNDGIVELKKTTWGNVLREGTNIFSITMDYELGMFPPSQGTLNGGSIKGITCYTPPAIENFKCEKKISSICAIKPVGSSSNEIKIGEGSAWAWGQRVDIYIPENRKGWAIGMAVSHTLFTNLMGFDAMSINEYFATTIQEINAGCEGSKLIAPSWVTKKYPYQDLINGGINCYDTTGKVAAGYFQQEMGGSWMEMFMNYPCFIPQVSKNSFIGDPNIGASFEFQSIVKTYHDYRNIAFWQYVKCWNPVGFIKDSKDPYAAVKILSLAYNQGMNSGAFEPIFVKNRTAALGASNLMDYISPVSPSGLDRLYAEQVNRLTKVLDNRIGDISWTDAAIWGVTDKSAHSFRGFYDTQIEWIDVEDYIKKITPFYSAFGVTESSFSDAVKPVFDLINGGNAISFRYQFQAVVDAIVIFLPAFDPKKGLSEVYGHESNTCFAPTAKMEGSDGGCGKNMGLTVYFSGKPPYKFAYKRTDVSPEAVYPEITTSQNPYLIDSSSLAEGTYAIISISDANSAGEVVCEPIEIKNNGVVLSAKLVKEGGVECMGTGAGVKVEIIGTGSGPFTIEYEKDGVAQPSVLASGSSKILIPSPAPKGTYRLTKISSAGCSTVLNESLFIDDAAVPVPSAQLVKYGEALCAGTVGGIQLEVTSTESGPFEIEYQKDGVLQPAVALSDSPYILVSPPAPKGTYRLTKITRNNCDYPLNNTLIIDDIVASDVKIDGKLLFCKQSSAILEAVTDPPAADIDSYQWVRDNENIQGADKKTYNAGQEGYYSVKITDKNGCESESQTVKVTEKCPDDGENPAQDDYPKFFTPNGDGHNDTWHFKNFDKYKKAQIRIFDRYGKFIIELSEHSPGWDGTYNNKPLFATDYWFLMIYVAPGNLSEERTYKGHFSLKR
jgi:gliding motility-associated-like protein